MHKNKTFLLWRRVEFDYFFFVKCDARVAGSAIRLWIVVIFHLLIQRLHRASFGVPSPLRRERWRHRSCTAPIRLQSSLICNAETRFIRRQYFISISIIIRTQEKNVLRTYACWKYHKWHRSGLQILREYHGVGAWALRTSFLKHRDLPWSIRANQCGLKPSFQCQD